MKTFLCVSLAIVWVVQLAMGGEQALIYIYMLFSFFSDGLRRYTELILFYVKGVCMFLFFYALYNVRDGGMYHACQ